MNKNFESRNELLREVLKRANKQEKEEHEEIRKKQISVVKRLETAQADYDELIEQSKRNEYPKESTKANEKPVSQMSNEEFKEYMRLSNKHTEEHFAWTSESFSIMTKQLEIVRQVIESIIELSNLGTDEKWLLLSIALRSQPTLMKFM